LALNPPTYQIAKASLYLQLEEKRLRERNSLRPSFYLAWGRGRRNRHQKTPVLAKWRRGVGMELDTLDRDFIGSGTLLYAGGEKDLRPHA
jgi:hypothetical protein